MSFVPYQVDYSVKNVSKTIGVSKKKVQFKFGFANPQALSEGLTGAQCRGSEHQVDFIWSLKSGKRQIVVDGKEAHFSESGMNGWTSDRTFQHPFNIYSSGAGTVRCLLVTTTPNSDAPGGNHPFDIRVGNVSYFDFSKIFQLGTPAMIARPGPSSGRGRYGRTDSYDPDVSQEERSMIARAKMESMRDFRQQRAAPPPPPAPVQENALISFDVSEPVPPQGPPARATTVSSVSLDSGFYPQSTAPPPAPVGAAYSNYTLPPAPAPQYGAPPPAYGAPPPAGYPQPSYGQAPPAPAAPAPAPYSNYTLPPAPAPAPAAPPAYGYSPQSAYGSPQPPAGTPTGYGAYPQQPQYGQAPGFASPQSAASYGSAPSFAQPPRT